MLPTLSPPLSFSPHQLLPSPNNLHHPQTFLHSQTLQINQSFSFVNITYPILHHPHYSFLITLIHNTQYLQLIHHPFNLIDSSSSLRHKQPHTLWNTLYDRNNIFLLSISSDIEPNPVPRQTNYLPFPKQFIAQPNQYFFPRTTTLCHKYSHLAT
jgi:hypothetical protein